MHKRQQRCLRICCNRWWHSRANCFRQVGVDSRATEYGSSGGPKSAETKEQKAFNNGAIGLLLSKDPVAMDEGRPLYRRVGIFHNTHQDCTAVTAGHFANAKPEVVSLV